MSNVSPGTSLAAVTPDAAAAASSVCFAACPHLRGYRASFVPGVNNVVIALHTPDGQVDSAVITRTEESHSLCYHPLLLVAESLCHALNVGVDPFLLQQLVQRATDFADQVPVDFKMNTESLGLRIDRFPAVRYVLESEGDPTKVIVIRPDLYVKAMSQLEFLRTCVE